jgi:hypothetical protein
MKYHDVVFWVLQRTNLIYGENNEKIYKSLATVSGKLLWNDHQ